MLLGYRGAAVTCQTTPASAREHIQPQMSTCLQSIFISYTEQVVLEETLQACIRGKLSSNLRQGHWLS